MVAESKNVDFKILAIIEHHHERMDGSGYPRGMEGAAIPLLARIAVRRLWGVNSEEYFI